MPEVFALVTDGMNAPKWRSGVLDIERVTGSGGVGTRYRQGVLTRDLFGAHGRRPTGS